jgi:hypothetical protein
MDDIINITEEDFDEAMKNLNNIDINEMLTSQFDNTDNDNTDNDSSENDSSENENTDIDNTDNDSSENENTDIDRIEIPDTLRYQPNINDRSINAGESIEFTETIFPLVFYDLYDDINFLEVSNKIILPKRILYDISKYDNIIYPIHFKINDYILGVYEFNDLVDNIYIPNYLMHKLNLQIGIQTTISLYNKEITKGTRIRIQPHSKEFLEIENPKEFLEQGLLKTYTCLSNNSEIAIPYEHSNMYFNIVQCEPEDTISLIDTDIEVDFMKPLDYIEPVPKPPINTNNNDINNNDTNNTNNINNTNSNINGFLNLPPSNTLQNSVESNNQNHDVFIPFSGTGHILGGKDD